MVPVLIKGQIKNKATVHEYVQNIAKHLKISRFQKPIVINFDKKLTNASGLCSFDYGIIEIDIAKNHFTFMEMMQTLAHEMIHAKQFLRKELDASKGQWAWKGRSAEGYKYKNQPWEKEAYRKELEVFSKCFPFHLPFTN